MPVRTNALAVAVALPLLMAASGCAKPAEAPPTATSASPAAQAPAGGGTDLAALVPIPANTKTTKGPDPLSENGVHQYFEVAGAPGEVMNAFKTALEGKGWAITAVTSHGGDHSGGGATFTGTLGEAYGVFDGGGYTTTTYIDVCTWPKKPADPECARGSGG